MWKIGGVKTPEPPGYSREVDPLYGAFYWKTEENDLLDDGKRLWDTPGFWTQETG
jgi:hypothetical protein